LGFTQISIRGNLTWFGVFPNSWGIIEIWDLHKSQLGGICPGLEFFQTVGEKLGFEIYTNLNWGEFDPVWSLSKQSRKNWDLEFTQISIGESDPFGVFPNSRGKIGI
jgi:hypothetical protein